MITIESSTEDLTADNGGTHLPRSIDPLIKLPLHQQERLRQIESRREEDEKLYPGGFGRRRSSTDNNLHAMSTIPVISVRRLFIASRLFQATWPKWK